MTSPRPTFCWLAAALTAACGSNERISSSPRPATGSESATAANAEARARPSRAPGVGCNFTTAVAWDEESFARVCQQAFKVWRASRDKKAAGDPVVDGAAGNLSQDFESFCSDMTGKSSTKNTVFSGYLMSLSAEEHLLAKQCPLQIKTLSNGVRKISDDSARKLSPQPL